MSRVIPCDRPNKGWDAPRVHRLSALRGQGGLPCVLLGVVPTVANVIDLYLASVLDLETIFCFLALQDMRFWPRNTPYRLVDFLSSGDPA